MPGRGGNVRCGGRGGRGRGRAHHGQTKTTPAKKKTIDDYYFYLGSTKQASDFDITREFVLNHIKKEFDRGNDIAEALRTETKPDTDAWKPTLTVSSDPDPDTKAREDKQYEMEYKAELDEALRRKRVFVDNTYKAYAFIWERCAKAMQNKLLARADFEKEIYNNPIKLIKAIKEHALHYQENRYAMAIVVDSFITMMMMKQKEGESLVDYTRRFRTAREVLESHLGGDMLLQKYVKQMDGYDEADKAKTRELSKKASEQFFAYLWIQ